VGTYIIRGRVERQSQDKKNTSVTPVFYNIGVSIMHEKIRGNLNKSVGLVAFFQGIVTFSRE
jgi:hypothetical protein